MIRIARFLVDQVREDLLARRLIIALRVHRGEICRERGDVMVILRRIVGQSLLA